MIQLVKIVLIYLLTLRIFSDEPWIILEDAHCKARLISENQVLIPGKSLRLGLWIKLDEDWHTYWVNPGDSGAGPILEWQFPKGYIASELVYPIPHRITTGSLESIAYENEVLFWLELKVPSTENAHLGALRTLSLNAEWLVCKEECVPAFLETELTLPISSKALQSPEADFLLRQKHPQRSEGLWEHREGELILSLPQEEPGKQIIDLFAYPEVKVESRKPIIEKGKGLSLLRLANQSLESFESGKFLAIVEDVATRQVSGVIYDVTQREVSIWWMIGFALLGGLLLNLMPCVFPILALKFYGVLQLGKEEQREVLHSQLLYQAGIICSFWVLAAALILFRNAGSSMGWGFHLQSPLFVAILILFFFLMGLTFLDVFTINIIIPKFGGELLSRDGSLGHFLTGVLAVVVASPCTAPFMGAAIGYALGQAPFITFILFTALGLGLGFPYLIFGLFPAMTRFLPSSGLWMVRFKEAMAFALFGTSVWLFYVLSAQVNQLALVSVLGCVVLAGFGAWAGRSFQGWIRNLVLLLSFALISVDLYYMIYSAKTRADESKGDEFWQAFSTPSLESNLSRGHSVFVNFTADWCLSCKANELYTFSSKEVRDYVSSSGLLMMKADWTNRNEEIGRILKNYGRAGVPMYLYYKNGSKKPIILPELLTPEIFLGKIQD